MVVQCVLYLEMPLRILRSESHKDGYMTELSNAAKKTLKLHNQNLSYYSLPELGKRGFSGIERMPFSAKIILESVLRQIDGVIVKEEHLQNVLNWKKTPGEEVPFKPARVLMQDFTGVPGVVDLAAMRDALADLGGDAKKINPLIPVDLVIDHSVQVDFFGSKEALAGNSEREFERNHERYKFLHWASESFDNLNVVPPATGIVHQVNLEYLAKVVQQRQINGDTVVFPDSLVGTDSHTTMINGLGVLGWGVGGIEAEAALLGQPLYIRMPDIIGVHLHGELKRGVTATDLVLRITQILREAGVVEKIVEFYGEGLDGLSLPDRATVSNMCPEYGATAALFPIDRITLEFLRNTGRSETLIDLVERYMKEQGMFRTSDSETPEYTNIVDLDLGSIEPSIAGPKRPQDRILLSDAKSSFKTFLDTSDQKDKSVFISIDGRKAELQHGAVVIAAITSCTNTSNPYVMVSAGLLAKNAVERGLNVHPYVKTSLAPGSKVVTRYLDDSGLSEYLDQLGFNVVGYGCTTCIGNSGPLRGEVSRAVTDNQIVAVSVLSGNRNFEGRIHPEVRGNYLASPPLVVAYALAGTIAIDLNSEPLGTGSDGKPVFLSDIWPETETIRRIVEERVQPALFNEEYANIYTGSESWNAVQSSGGDIYAWDPESSYIKRPPFFEGLTLDFSAKEPITSARALAFLGDSVTTDHISPAGIISPESPAASWLKQHGVEQKEFNSYGSRRGNHEVMMRGTFANIRIRNKLVPGTEGGVSVHIPSGEQSSIYQVAMKYQQEKTPLIVLAGKDYGMGSSRDWAAKGVTLLGVRAVIAESYERIHRSNLIGMGVLPLQYERGETAESLGLTGTELFDIGLIGEPRQVVAVTARADSGPERQFNLLARIDTQVEMEYYLNGGILHTVLRQMAR